MDSLKVTGLSTSRSCILDRLIVWCSYVHNVCSANLLFVFKNQKDKGKLNGH